MKEIRLGTIGSGSIVHSFLDAAAITDGIVLEAVYSRDEERGRRLAEQYGASKVYTELPALLEDAQVNTVYIASPNSLHYEQAKTALLHGKHVICEKPFCTKAAQVKELAALARERGLCLADATPTAFLPNFEIVKQLLGRIGRIRLVLCSYCQYSSRYNVLRNLRSGAQNEKIPNVFLPEFAGGSLQDINYYNVYFAAALFGQPETVCYYPNMCETGVDTSGILILKYPDFVFEGAGAKDTWGVNSAQIQGEDGYLYIENGANGIEKVRLVTTEGEEEYNRQTVLLPASKPASRWYYEVQELTRLITEERFEEIYDRLDITALTIQIMEEGRKAAGIRFPSDDAEE